MKISLFSLLFIVSFSFAQKVKTQNAFPANFVGKWQGKLNWYSNGKFKKEFTMRLNIQPTDSVGKYTWQIMYGDDSKDNRPYFLRAIDTARGHWVVDENDGIKIDTYVSGNSAYSAFTVGNSTIMDNYTVDGKVMEVEFFTILLKESNKTGQGTEEHPFVESYKVISLQKGVLRKMDNFK
jgi:hypothetical protein